MGTSCSLFGVGLSQARLLQGEFWVRRLSARLTRFSPDSELTSLNASEGRWVGVSPEMEELLHAAIRAFDLSAGLVNAAVLPSMVAIGYARPLAEGNTAIALEGVRLLPPLPDVLVVRRGAARLEPGSGIDLGGIAKGWMADRLRQWLGPNAIANLGGDLSAGGGGPNGDGWPVGLAGATVMLEDHGAATSSTRRRRWRELHHLIDPRTGLPAQTGLDEVSVVARDGFEGEVVAKTALLLGPDLAPTYCAGKAMAWWLNPSQVGAATA